MIPIIYVTDMARAADFYEAIGAVVGKAGRNPYWTELELGPSRFALHIVESIEPRPQRVTVSLLADGPLEQVAERFTAAGVPIRRPITDEPFGRSLVIEDPDGLAIQVNEHR